MHCISGVKRLPTANEVTRFEESAVSLYSSPDPSLPPPPPPKKQTISQSLRASIKNPIATFSGVNLLQYSHALDTGTRTFSWEY